MSDDRSPTKQIKDLAGLFTGKNKIEGNRIVSKNPPAPPPQRDPETKIKVDVDVRRD